MSIRDYGLKPLQMKILEIVKYIDQLCKDHGITYYLMGGSALGAVRHGGFIPWDDDFDIFMIHSEYHKFIEICRECLDKDRFYLQEGNTAEWPLHFTKLRMNGTTYIESCNKNTIMHQGIFVDIFCFNNVSSSKILTFYQFLCGKLLTAQALATRNYSTNSTTKKIAMLLMRIFPGNLIKGLLLNQIRMFNGKETGRVGHFFGKAPFRSAIYSRECLGRPQYIKFENLMLPVPENVHEFLTIRFGDYMKPPPAETIKSVQHAEFIDLEKDYSEYVQTN